MKSSLCVLLAVLSFNTFAQNINKSISEKIDQLQRAQLNGDFNRLSRQELDIVNDGLSRATSILRDDPRRPGQGQGQGGFGQGQGQIPGYGQGQGQVPGYGQGSNGGRPDWRYQSNYERNLVVAYAGYNCSSSEKLTEVKAFDRCDQLSALFGNKNVYSILINNSCISAPVASFKNFCPSLVELASSQKARTKDVEVFSNYNCNLNDSMTVIDPGVNCNAIGTVLKGKNVYSLRIDGKNCIAPLVKAFSPDLCLQYQDAIVSMYENDGVRRRGDTVELYTGYNCNDQENLASIRRGDNCNAMNALFGGKNIYSVKFRGQCIANQVSTFLNLCENYAR
jgi:hypothetical protein